MTTDLHSFVPPPVARMSVCAPSMKSNVGEVCQSVGCTGQRVALGVGLVQTQEENRGLDALQDLGVSCIWKKLEN